MNLTGHWKGKYIYGQGYPDYMIGMEESFYLFITDENGSIAGMCIDKITQSMNDNEAHISGVFFDNTIKFTKTYKIHGSIDEDETPYVDEGVETNGVDYVGRLKRKLFSRTYYFEGEWSINHSYKRTSGSIKSYKCLGYWSMDKIK